MRTFRTFLIEEKMTPERALELLGLTRSSSLEDLKRVKREVNLKYHPDRNPDPKALDTLQTLNAAAEVAEKVLGAMTHAASSRVDWEAIKEKTAALQKVIEDLIREKTDTTAFEQYFQRIFQEPFTTSAHAQKVSDSVHYQFEWRNANSGKVFSMLVYVNVSPLLHAKVLADPESFVQMSIYTEILVDRKKVKLFQREWNMKRGEAALRDPDLIFPKDKLNRQIKKAGERKMALRDILLTFEHELKAQISGSGKDTWVSIPVGPYRASFFRTVFLNAGGWMPWGLSEKVGKKLGTFTTLTITEPDDIGPFVDAMKDVQADADRREGLTPEQAIALVNAAIAPFKRHREPTGSA